MQSLVLGRVLNKDLLEGVEEVASFGLPWRLEAGLFWESLIVVVAAAFGFLFFGTIGS